MRRLQSTPPTPTSTRPGNPTDTPSHSRCGQRRRTRAGLRIALLLSLLIAGCALPQWPVHGVVSSPFGIRRNGLRFHIHRGVDIAVPAGTPVRAMSAGRVAFAGESPGFGLLVILDHGPKLQTLYGHLSELRVRTGDTVEHRAVLGLAGSTGRSTAPHVHFEIRRRGRAEDPVPLLGGPPPPP